jgi:Holliday junction resolvase-like predicted endonuclease
MECMVYVSKVDGRRERFDRSKVVATCLRLNVARDVAESAASEVESNLYDGIPTREIIRMIYRFLAEHRPEVRLQFDLRKAISLLRSKPDFEQYVRRLLSECGYEVVGPQIVKGRCVEHEIDAIASMKEETTYVEIKHHVWPHTYTGLDIFLQAQATFEDLAKGYEVGANHYPFRKAMVVCNTKLSDHARLYADCAQVSHIGWKSPPGKSLEELIIQKKLYPITMDRILDARTEARLADAGILLLRGLAGAEVKELSKRTRMNPNKLNRLASRARKIMESCQVEQQRIA